MGWHAQLSLDYQLQSDKTIARYVHEGPLRILQSLYPEGGSVCHNVLVHPPGGLVGGDTLDLRVQVEQGAHGLITTPGATRFYRSEGEPAVQCSRLVLAAGSRLEWLPLEALCYSACRAENRITMDLQPGAELMGWDITALGLPSARLPFVQGQVQLHMEVPGVWLERGILQAGDTRLLDGPAGMAGHRCLASFFFVAGSPISKVRREMALEGAREMLALHALAGTSGVTSPHPQVLVLRVLAPVVEPAMHLLRMVRAAWRSALWNLPAAEPRVWSM